MAVTLDDLTRATARLAAQPTDHGAWLEVAVLLEALGGVDDAEAAFAAIGEGAHAGGQVALAIACARHLAGLGSVRGPELLERIVESYAHTKPPRAATVPALPVASSASIAILPELPAPTGDALADARATVAALGPWLATRKPPKRASVPLLSALTKPMARVLLGVITARAVPAGTIIIDVGEPASALYWLAHGTVGVERDGAALGELHSGAFFGEIALVGGTRRTARVVAQGDVWLLEIPARAIETAAEKQPKLADVLASHARRRLLANLVRTSELFRALGEDHRDALLDRFTSEVVPGGTRFITEGATNELLWVVASGRCQVSSGGASLAELGPGAAVGEISLVSGAPAVADVTALEPSVLLKLSRHDFDEVSQQHPALLAEVKKLVVARETANRALFQDASDLIV